MAALAVARRAHDGHRTQYRGRDTLDQMSAVYRRTVDEHFLPHLGDEVEALKVSLERVADSAREACPIDAANPAPKEPSSAQRP